MTIRTPILAPILFIVLLVALLPWVEFSGSRGELDPRLLQAASQMAREAAGRLPQGDTPRRLLLLPLKGDDTHEFQRRLFDALSRNGQLTLVSGGGAGGYLEKADIGLKSPATLAGAQALARLLPGEQALWGEIQTWRLDETTGSVRLAFTLYLMAEDEIQWQQPFEYQPVRVTQAQGEPPPATAGDSALPRLLAWLLGTLAIPLVFYPLTRDLLRRRDNSASLLMIGLYSGLSLLAAALLAWQRLQGTGLAIALAGAALLAVLLHYLVCAWLARMILE